jgi:glutathione S-transferase
MKHFGIPFDEKIIFLDQPQTTPEIKKYSPSGRVPVLVHNETRVWDSLAICEYLTELYPDKEMWPENPKARAWARSISCEMHSGFQALRENLPMKCKEKFQDFDTSKATTDIARINDIWTEARTQHRLAGPYLFGQFSIADAMYAPVVFRFNTYGVKTFGFVKDYVETMLKHPSMQEWVGAARDENAEMARYNKT